MGTRRETAAKREMLRRELMEACRSGSLTPGQMVPTLGELTDRYGLSYGVVHQEIKRLTAEGVLYSVPRVGTFVAPSSGVGQGSSGSAGAGNDRDTVALLSPGLLVAPTYRNLSGWSVAVDQGAAHALHESRFHVLSLHRHSFLRPMTQEDFDRFTERNLFGLIVTDTEGVGENLRIAFQRKGLPVVALDNHLGVGPCDRVVSDHERGAYELTRWLIERGRTRVLNCWPEPADGYWFPLRRRGYERAMKEAGLQPLPSLVAPYGLPDSQEDFHALARQLAGYLIEYLTGPQPVDALMLGSDGHCPLTAAAIRFFGLVPNEDVLLAGYDNYWENMPYREYETTAPAVTMDKQNWEIGQQAAQLLVERGRGQLPATWQDRVVSPVLVTVDAVEKACLPRSCLELVGNPA